MHKSSFSPRVLLCRSQTHDRIAEALDASGFDLVCAPLTRTVYFETPQIKRVRKDVENGKYQLIVFASWRGCCALIGESGKEAEALVAAKSQGTSFAAVGERTAEWVQKQTLCRVDIIGAGSAQKLLTDPRLAAPFSHKKPRALLPQSQIAPERLAEGLRTLGWEVERVNVYTTVSCGTSELAGAVQDAIACRDLTYIVLTASSQVRALASLAAAGKAHLAHARCIALGASTAATVRECALPLAAICASPRPEAVVEAIHNDLRLPEKKEHLDE